jgi:DNA-binding ferritin-like protein
MTQGFVEWIGDEGSSALPRVPHDSLQNDNALAEWFGVDYAELSVILVHLRFLYVLHQTHHWSAMGDPFYGDHQLFQRLYESTAEQIDDVAEKAVGMGSERNVDLCTQLQQLFKLSAGTATNGSVPQSSELVRRSLYAEKRFVELIGNMLDRLREQGKSTNGIENLLQGLADAHERAIYLLKRRILTPAIGM